jgi:hypothetical protein
MKQKTFDRKCFDLAEHFLLDEPEINCAGACDELAYLIQTTIEDWMSSVKSEELKRWTRLEDHEVLVARGEAEPF